MQFRHAKEVRDGAALRYEGWKIGVSVVIFLVLASVVPVYNKVVFKGLAGDRGFPFPVTTAFLQLFFCAVVLTAMDLAAQLTRVVQRRASRAAERVPLVADAEAAAEAAAEAPPSWILGPNLGFKLRLIAPIGALFGLKYGVTNWGLHLLPLAPHLLLQATDLMWTVLFARLLAGEMLNSAEMLTCAGSTLGTMLIAYRTHQTVPDGLYSVAVNLVSPVLLGLCITTLRIATHRLLVQESAPGGRTRNMSPVELSAIKLWVSALVIFPFAFLFENNGVAMLGLGPPKLDNNTAIGLAMHESPALGLAALGGGLFVLMFQVNMTWLSKMASAVTVGMVGGVKIVPQWLTALLFSEKVDLGWLNILGATTVLLSCVFWTYLRYDPVITESQPRYRYKQLRSRTGSRNSSASRSSSPTELATSAVYGATNPP